MIRDWGLEIGDWVLVKKELIVECRLYIVKCVF